MFELNGFVAGAAAFSIVVVIFIVFFSLSKRYALKRKNEIREFCLARGFSFAEDEALLSGVWNGDFGRALPVPAPSGVPHMFRKLFSSGPASLGFTGLEIFGTGFDRKAGNIVTLPFGKSSLLFLDYEYSESAGEGTNVYSHSVAALKLVFPLPAFTLRPEHLGDKILAMAGFEDIDIPGFGEFSKKYCLKGPEKNSVMIFFTPQRAMALEKTDGWRIQCSGNYLALFKKEGYIPVSDYLSFIEEVKALLDSLGLKT
ncbi:MAG: hypothetical protein COT17_00175 [Elusimicrobia bacterium CG08_land_8_20_14_0_20_51_18]|nr:MAG: hypothetical protein COT17_00175 [Elusimicrobia bacterium CG08_land_8_20_14_0_20_51_18]